MRKSFILLSLLFLTVSVQAQFYIDRADAIHANSTSITEWATSCSVERGYINISDQSFTFTQGEITSNKAFQGDVADACGNADGLGCLSLGDGGSAILQFSNPVRDGVGYDFVVFENGFFYPTTQTEFAFVELAFVEVSSDGENFFRFPTQSLMPYENQIGTFENVEWTQYSGFAGNLVALYGNAFDITEIPENALLDKQRITHIRVIDAVGCIQPEFATYDSYGNRVNDPWPTPFNTCGFDLDAVGVINSTANAVEQETFEKVMIAPNPATDEIKISGISNVHSIEIFNSQSQMVLNVYNQNLVDISALQPGCYILKIVDGAKIVVKKLIKN